MGPSLPVRLHWRNAGALPRVNSGSAIGVCGSVWQTARGGIIFPSLWRCRLRAVHNGRARCCTRPFQTQTRTRAVPGKLDLASCECAPFVNPPLMNPAVSARTTCQSLAADSPLSPISATPSGYGKDRGRCHFCHFRKNLGPSFES